MNPMSRLAYILNYAVNDLLPFRIAGETSAERAASLWATSRRWLTTGLNVLTLATLIVTALVIGGLVIGTTSLLREYIEENPLALVVEIHGGLGASVKTISEEDEQEIRSFTIRQDGKITSDPDSEDSRRAVHRVAGWNDYALWFFKKDGSRDTDFASGRTVQPNDPGLAKLSFSHQTTDGFFKQPDLPHLIVTESLIEQLGYDKPPAALDVDYRQKSAPLQVVGVAKWLPAGDFIISEAFYRMIRDRKWQWPPMHRNAYLGPVSAEQGKEILEKAGNYFTDQEVKAAIAERTGSDKWIKVTLSGKTRWDEEYWTSTFFPTISLYLGDPAWFKKLSAGFDDALQSDSAEWSSVDIGFTRASVYVKELSLVPGVVDALKARGLGVDDRIAQDVVFLQQVSAFGRRLFAWVIGAVAFMAAVNIGLSFAQTIRRKQAQIGILRAYGASRAFVFSIFITEAALVWIIAAVLGLLIAFPAGNAIGEHLMKVWHQKQELGSAGGVIPKFFRAPASLLLFTLGGSLLVCWIATGWAAFHAAQVNPATAVRSRE
ncbi:MAG: FtsX-like permease family protein [Planctomycetota bacterium]|nr:FtsX-like permease family protein [Planctomycetota bacterium]MDA1142525.1 FtsX-like permease family protein [Planctomycetota bacterium]